MKAKDENWPLAAKGFTVLFPVLIVGISRADFVGQNVVFKLVWSNLICEHNRILVLILVEKRRADLLSVIFCVSIGSIFVVLILYNYVRVHRNVASSESSGHKGLVQLSFRRKRSKTNSRIVSEPAPSMSMRSESYDRWLIARFLCCFALSNVMQASVIVYYFLLRSATLLSCSEALQTIACRPILRISPSPCRA